MLKRRALSERGHLVDEHSGYGARLLNAMLTVRLKEAKSSCDVACDELPAAKELLRVHDIALGAVDIGSATGSGEQALVQSSFAKGSQVDHFLSFRYSLVVRTCDLHSQGPGSIAGGGTFDDRWCCAPVEVSLGRVIM